MKKRDGRGSPRSAKGAVVAGSESAITPSTVARYYVANRAIPTSPAASVETIEFPPLGVPSTGPLSCLCSV